MKNVFSPITSLFAPGNKNECLVKHDERGDERKRGDVIEERDRQDISVLWYSECF